MKHADPDELMRSVKEAVGSLPFGSSLKGVDVVPGDLDAEGDFLRIIVHFESLKDLSNEELDAITSSIEGEVSGKDDRFPSVRFADA